MAIVKISCPHCEDAVFIEVTEEKGTYGARLKATVLPSDKARLRLFEEVLNDVLERHNGIAPPSIVVMEGSKRGLKQEFVRKTLNSYVNTGKLHIENGNVMR
ncbi:MAG TPA: hypothetical protein ENN11_02520 [Methanomicrobia archaeon]|nr:hypothetical protein [Methanomicrobia archaeon]